MSKDKDMKHLSEIEIILYCDKESSHEDMLKATKHLEGCESCSRLVVKAQNFSGLLYKALEDNLSIEKKGDCLSDMEISAYIENRVSSEERVILEKHLSTCGYCLSILVDTGRVLQEGISEEEPHFSYEKIMGALKQQLRENRGKSLLEKFTAIVEKSTPPVKKALKNIKSNIEVLLNNIFSYPSPRFAPVFGEHDANVLSPFGKIRYPIIFEWVSYKEADSYTISIEGSDWSLTTQETRIEVNLEELRIDYGREYMWELKVMSGEKVIDEITGFLFLAVENEIKELMEIEKQLINVEPEQERLILWGGILEEKEFYMEAIEQYKKAYALEPLDGVAYRVAYCYNKLELEELRDKWNKKIYE